MFSNRAGATRILTIYETMMRSRISNGLANQTNANAATTKATADMLHVINFLIPQISGNICTGNIG